MAQVTFASESALSNKGMSERLCAILDALLGLTGFSGYGPTIVAVHGSSAASDSAANIVAGATNVSWLNAGNVSAAWSYLKLYNKATAPSNADTPVDVIPLPPGGGVFGPLKAGPFPLGLGIRIVKGNLDNDNTAQAANDVTWNLKYSQ